MGKFLDTQYTGTINSITDSMKSRLDNTFYTFTDKAPTIITYYNINTKHSTLDESTDMAYSYTDGDSPLRYNKINKCIALGLERIEVQLNEGDFGVESDSIEGTMYIPPNAFKPYPQDYFTIDHIENDYLFKVKNVTLDTLPTGANIYKIEYRLSSHDSDRTDIDSLVVESYTMDTVNIGTNLTMVIKDDDHAYIERLEKICREMKLYFRSLFYSTKCQTFIFRYDDKNFYDPYMIEFIKRHELMNDSEIPYLYVTHQLAMPYSFPLEYSKTIFNSIEEHDKNTINNQELHGMLINDKTSIMYYNIENYYRVFHGYKMGNYFKIKGLDEATVQRIRDNEGIPTDQWDFFKNIITDYYNYDTNTKNDRYNEMLIDSLDDFNYTIEDCVMFYYIPIIIYILEDQISKIMRNLSR